MSRPHKVKAPLTGIRVLDLADEKAAFSSKLLRDLGAEVIKVEGPSGDPARNNSPFFDNTPSSHSSLSFLYNNGGKLGASLDLKDPIDRKKFLPIAAVSDVIIESFEPGYLDDLEMGFPTLSKLNPRLVLASVTGFGQSGPHSRHKSCDLIASASGGQMYVCGRPGKQPLKPYGGQTYYLSSLFAALGITLALRARESSGRGQHIDISAQEAAAAALEHVLVQHFYDGKVPSRQGSLQWNSSSDIFPCKDGYVLMTFNREWDTLVELLDQKSMAADLKHPAWSDENFRRDHIDNIEDVFTLWTCVQSNGDVFKLGQSMRFPWAALNNIDEVAADEQLNNRGYFINASHPLVQKEFKATRPVINFTGGPNYICQGAPSPGEHNEMVFRMAQAERHAKIRESGGQPAKLPLEGVRVLDFTWMLAGPYATRLLADFGAEVIKVQSKKTATGAEQNDTGYFANWNRNKLGITLDLSKPEARNIVLELVKKSDVVMENFTPRVMDNWNLNYEQLKLVKHDLVMVSLSGFGHSGPWREFAALGPTIQALSGLTALTSYESGAPTGLGFAYADHISGLYAALAVMAALRQRDTSGAAAYIDISEYEATCSLMGPALLDYFANGRIAGPMPNRPEGRMAAPYGCYRCRGEDRWIAIAVFNDDEWESLCSVMGSPDWARPEKFSSMQGRWDNSDELDEKITEWTARNEREDLVEQLQSAGIAAAPVNDAHDLARDLHLKERGFFIDLQHPALGKVRSDGNPIRMSGTPARFEKAAPLLGEDNRYVFRDVLGMDGERFKSYLESRVIG
ncbi:MAG: CaiB/BaiF CoA transferase family protein [Dehalococcoidia bacterium]